MSERQITQRPKALLALYGLAWAGGVIAYMPFLTLLLPVRVSALAGPGADVSWLAYIAFAGAIAASLANILFGWLSDLIGSRRNWIIAGLALSTTSLLAVDLAHSLPSLIALIIVWQIGVNMMLGPLAAWAGDLVPDRHKGTLGGVMAFGPALGAASGSLVTWPGLLSANGRMIAVALLVIACILPLVLAAPGRKSANVDAPPEISAHHQAYKPIRRMWLARLLVQIAEAALFTYLYFWFRSIDGTFTDNATAAVFMTVLFVSAPLALAAGRWSDRHARPLLPLIVGIALSVSGLVLMAGAEGLYPAVASYAVFGISSSVFLSLHTAQTLRLLPKAGRRGRDMGLFNLTNTLPSMIMPWLTISLVPDYGYVGLLLALALLCGFAGILLISIDRRA